MEIERPLIVVDSPPALVEARRRLECAGMKTAETWQQTPGFVCVGVVADAGDAAAALLSAVWGAGIVIHATAPAEVVERLVEDLRRLGPVDYRTGEVPSEPALTHDECLHLSRRTADRRLASARVKLGAESTTQAVIAFSHASGW